ncbi:nucleotidyltransferase family protein [bacterium]|nr:nucleotidyltransferase family protein [bacterium]
MISKLHILSFLSDHKESLKQNFGVTQIGLFGSYARDEANEESDVDIAVEIEAPNKFRSFFGLKNYLESNLYPKIDLGIESTLKPIAKEFVKKEIIYV